MASFFFFLWFSEIKARKQNMPTSMNEMNSFFFFIYLKIMLAISVILNENHKDSFENVNFIH